MVIPPRSSPQHVKPIHMARYMLTTNLYLDGLSSGIFSAYVLCFPLGIKTKSVLLFCSSSFPQQISPFIERTVWLCLCTTCFFPIPHYTYVIIFTLHSQRWVIAYRYQRCYSASSKCSEKCMVLVRTLFPWLHLVNLHASMVLFIIRDIVDLSMERGFWKWITFAFLASALNIRMRKI